MNNNSNVDDVVQHSNTIKRYMLTTLDNPFNPFTQYDLWLSYDLRNNYNTLAYLARIAKVPDDLSENDETAAINEAIDEIVMYNITGLYVKVEEGNFIDRSQSVNLSVD
jgi:glycerol-3-phosphate O-acyltransferase